MARAAITNPAALLVAGASLMLIDHYDRTYLLTKDLQDYVNYLRGQRILNQRLGRPYTFADYWEERWRLFPNKPAIKFEGITYTFSDVDHAINRMAHWLLAQGVTSGDVVAVLMENRPEHMFTWMAVTKIGARVALINHNLKSSLLLASLERMQSHYIVVGYELVDGIYDELTAMRTKGVTVMTHGSGVPGCLNITATLGDMPYTAPPRSLRDGQTLDSVFGYAFTSGTAGAPTPAPLLHRRLLSIAVFFPMRYDILSSDVIYSPLPLYHFGGLFSIGMMIHTGATLCLARRFRARRFWSDVREHDVTVIQYVGEACRYLLRNPPSELDRAHKVRLAVGSGLRADIWRVFQERFQIPEVVEFYSSTQGRAFMGNRVQLSTGDGTGAVGHCGPLLRRTSLFVLAQYDRAKGELVRNARGFCILQTGRGRVGELLWRLPPSDALLSTPFSPQVARDVVIKGDCYMRTGDLFHVDDRGFYYFVDRVSDNFAWKGEAVSASMVSMVLLQFSGVLDASVYGIRLPGIDGQPVMAAIVPGSADGGLDMRALGAYVSAELPRHAVPVFIRMMPRMQYTWTISQRKVELRDEGADPDAIKDPLFFFDRATKEYKLLTRQAYADILGGSTRL